MWWLRHSWTCTVVGVSFTQEIVREHRQVARVGKAEILSGSALIVVAAFWIWGHDDNPTPPTPSEAAHVSGLTSKQIEAALALLNEAAAMTLQGDRTEYVALVRQAIKVAPRLAVAHLELAQYGKLSRLHLD